MTETKGTLEGVYREHGAKLWRALIAYTADRELASDALAEAFAQALARGDAIRKPVSWVWTAAFRIAAGQLKELTRRSSGVADPAYDMPEPIADVVAALAKLPAKQRLAIVLHDYADRPTDEVARAVGASRATVHVHLSVADDDYGSCCAMTSERLNVLDELEPPDLWNEIEGRQPSREPVAAFMPRRPRALTFAVAAAIGIASILVATSALGPNSIPLDRPVLRSAGQDLDGWTVGVEVRHSSGGPLEIQVGPIHAAKENDAHPWIQHEVILTNTGSETLHFDDIRTSTFLGANHELLAADQGCGYARNGPNALVEPGACLLYLDAFSIPPGGTVRREVTLFKDLPGMAPLTAGKYVFEKMYRFAIGSSDTKTTAHVRLIYDVDKA